MAQPSPPAAPAAPPSKSSSNEPRYLVLLVVTILVALAGGLFAAVAIGALLAFFPAPVGVAVGALIAFGLPLFLAFRAAAALKRKRRGLLLRRLASLLLIVAAQLAIAGAILQYSPRTTGNMAYTAHQVLALVGGLPIVSDLLFAHAERDNAIPGTELARLKKQQHGKPVMGPDGGVLLVDGGVVYEGVDGGAPARAADGGTAGADGGVVAGAAADAGSAEPAPVITRGPAPPRPKPGVALSPRTEGKPARAFALGVQTSSGDSLIFVGTLGAGGQLSSRIVDLASVEKLGEPTVIDTAEDGNVAAILGGQHVVVARAGKTSADVVKALEPGQRLGGQEIQAVRDVVIGPGGSGLAIVDVLTGQNGEVAQDLVTLPKGQAAPQVLRKAGDKVPGSATDATVVKGFNFKKTSGAAAVLVSETYLDGGDDVGTRLSGDTWLVNPQRLLAVKIDQPKALIEVANTGTEPSGIDGKELQIFGDAWLLPDGRALFDANFLDKGADGWLFVAKTGAGLFALAPDLGDKAPWTKSPPRARYLEAGSDGSFLFRRDDGAVVVTSIEKPGDASAALLGADALASDGKKLGVIESVDVPILARGSEWIIATASMKGATVHDALVLASKADAQNGKAEVLLEVGAPLPETLAKGKKERLVQSLRFGKGRDELLWQR